MKKKMLSMLLALAMVLTFIPTVSLATSVDVSGNGSSRFNVAVHNLITGYAEDVTDAVTVTASSTSELTVNPANTGYGIAAITIAGQGGNTATVDKTENSGYKVTLGTALSSQAEVHIYVASGNENTGYQLETVPSYTPANGTAVTAPSIASIIESGALVILTDAFSWNELKTDGSADSTKAASGAVIPANTTVYVAGDGLLDLSVFGAASTNNKGSYSGGIDIEGKVVVAEGAELTTEDRGWYGSGSIVVEPGGTYGDIAAEGAFDNATHATGSKVQKTRSDITITANGAATDGDLKGTELYTYTINSGYAIMNGYNAGYDTYVIDTKAELIAGENDDHDTNAFEYATIDVKGALTLNSGYELDLTTSTLTAESGSTITVSGGLFLKGVAKAESILDVKGGTVTVTGSGVKGSDDRGYINVADASVINVNVADSVTVSNSGYLYLKDADSVTGDSYIKLSYDSVLGYESTGYYLTPDAGYGSTKDQGTIRWAATSDTTNTPYVNLYADGVVELHGTTTTKPTAALTGYDFVMTTASGSGDGYYPTLWSEIKLVNATLDLSDGTPAGATGYSAVDADTEKFTVKLIGDSTSAITVGYAQGYSVLQDNRIVPANTKGALMAEGTQSTDKTRATVVGDTGYTYTWDDTNGNWFAANTTELEEAIAAAEEAIKELTVASDGSKVYSKDTYVTAYYVTQVNTALANAKDWLAGQGNDDNDATQATAIANLNSAVETLKSNTKNGTKLETAYEIANASKPATTTEGSTWTVADDGTVTVTGDSTYFAGEESGFLTDVTAFLKNIATNKNIVIDGYSDVANNTDGYAGYIAVGDTEATTVLYAYDSSTNKGYWYGNDTTYLADVLAKSVFSYGEATATISVHGEPIKNSKAKYYVNGEFDSSAGTNKDGYYPYTVANVTLKLVCTGISIEDSEIDLPLAGTQTVTFDSDVVDKVQAVESSDSNVATATISGKKVTVKGSSSLTEDATAEITVTVLSSKYAANGNATATITVTVHAGPYVKVEPDTVDDVDLDKGDATVTGLAATLYKADGTQVTSGITWQWYDNDAKIDGQTTANLTNYKIAQSTSNAGDHTLVAVATYDGATYSSAEITFKATYDTPVTDTTATVDKDGVATVDPSTLNLPETTEKPLEVNVDATTEDGDLDSTEVIIPEELTAELADDKVVESTTVETDAGAVTLPAESVAAASGDGSTAIKIDIAKSATLTDDVKALNADLASALEGKALNQVDIDVYKVTLDADGKVVDKTEASLTNQKPITVKANYPTTITDTSKLVVLYVADDGSIEKMPIVADSIKNGTLQFTTTHLSSFIVTSSDYLEGIEMSQKVEFHLEKVASSVMYKVVVDNANEGSTYIYSYRGGEDESTIYSDVTGHSYVALVGYIQVFEVTPDEDGEVRFVLTNVDQAYVIAQSDPVEVSSSLVK